MTPRLISSYAQALDHIERNGHLFDLGQIEPAIIAQLLRDPRIKSAFDSWPIRGCGEHSGEWVRVFEMAH